ncbi:class III poly(R)-hydroxyalkanoic acid synthase subunit PhaE [Luteimonas viscosa]|uniref:Poly(3-hydroxyalkanoate) polymerase subunit PhaE n=2 Tax=Luteimonas viscosa TaxID=1132694 RepID=A0A5D4XK69_9GAMM|nr:class III poly(R)-hydroxyalkanoic acid synthase subunit PhaE [Luteimonas viscosa]
MIGATQEDGMANPGFGFGAGTGSTDEFERLARQYWGAWGDALRNSIPGAAPPDPVRMGNQAWQDAIDWWTRQASGRSAHDDTLWRFNRQASDWYAQMQRVAAQFGGGDSTAADVAAAWKEALGGGSVNVFADMFRSMAGNGVHGVEQWSEDAAPWLRLLRTEGSSLLQMPAFGFAREHQERAQALAAAQLEAQEASNAFNTLLLKSSESAFKVFERMLAEHEAPGLQITSARALFDLWVEAAEQAYAETALSEDYRTAYGNLVNAQMKLRAGVQKEVEIASSLLGMPTRSELDGAHRKIVELERALRRMRDRVEQGGAGPSAPSKPRGASSRERDDARPATARRAAKPAAADPATAAAAKSGAKPAQGKAANGKAARRATKRSPAGKPVPARKRAPASPARVARSPTNGFSTAIPVAPQPLARDADA